MPSFNKPISRRRLIYGLPAATAFATLAGPSAWLRAAHAASAGRGQQEQQGDIYLELRGRAAQAIALAVPPLSLVAGAEEEATVLHDVLWNDLHHSMVFDLIDPDFYPSLPMGDTEPDWTAWRRTGAEAMIRGFARRTSGDGLVVEFRLYDVQSGAQITGKSYGETVPRSGPIVSNRRLRNIAHAFSDEAVLYFTGIPGVASTQVAYVSERRGPKEIYVIDYDGFNEQRITNDGGLALSPAFSPAGDRIAYVTYRIHEGGVPNVDIAMLSARGGVPPVVVRSEGHDSGPAWSPDGSRIAFSSDMDGKESGNAEIYTARPDGSDVRRITSNSALDFSPTFSPDGREIAFISTRAGGQHLYKMSVDGSDIERLRVEGTQIDSPAWNPNPQISDLIAYAASEGGNSFQIFVYSLRTNQSIKLTRGYGRCDSPSWSADGRQLVFEAAQGGQNHIFAMGLDGSRLRKLTSEGNNQSPSWGGR